jgi:hypothetical protein
LISEKSATVKESAETMFRQLILKPAQSISYQTEIRDDPPLSVIVLDALDECGGDGAYATLLHLLALFDELPDSYAVFICSRPESTITKFFKGHPKRVTYDLDVLDHQQTLLDIRTHAGKVLGNLKEDNDPEEDGDPEEDDQGRWPPLKDEIDMFSDRCGGLFEILAVYLREINPVNVVRTWRFRVMFDNIKNRGLCTIPC